MLMGNKNIIILKDFSCKNISYLSPQPQSQISSYYITLLGFDRSVELSVWYSVQDGEKIYENHM